MFNFRVPGCALICSMSASLFSSPSSWNNICQCFSVAHLAYHKLPDGHLSEAWGEGAVGGEICLSFPVLEFCIPQRPILNTNSALFSKGEWYRNRDLKTKGNLFTAVSAPRHHHRGSFPFIILATSCKGAFSSVGERSHQPSTLSCG